jgi:hypothetical protein
LNNEAIMSPSNEQHDLTRHLIDQVVREQPVRRAPATLESRVFAEIERQALMSWWHKSFEQWPRGARIGFLVASCGFVKLTLVGITWLVIGARAARVETALNPAATLVRTAASLISTAMEASALVIHIIPQSWLYGAIVSSLLLYLALFGIIATGYRMLYSPR